ncbi:chemotaxis protein CheB [Nocardioides panaciterrulae]|uniref:protein-glutamate methylesterase n=1 Tax=Nocardioides panaciterrulae TaxID=661492 RepID=A0A7Y9E4U9_9ACTN|nr:two-component system chemotaxis response regulator CheB [Nocardioides panaciterrulae]
MTEVSRPTVVVVGASAGGVEALRELAAALPADFPGCVLVVLHVPPSGASALPAILARAGPLPARHAVEGEPLAGGTILVAPPDRHLVVADGVVTLTRGPQENGHRPAIDVLFRSAARAQGPRVVAVVLSGSLDDGAAGMVAVRQQGGVGLVQDFDEALFDAMPRAAATAAAVDQVLPAAAIATELARLVKAPPEPVPAPTPLMNMETAMADLAPGAMHDPDRPGTPSGFACPDCHGALFEITEGPLVRYRCRVGHAWSPESLVARQTVSLESALWMALRSLEEKAALNRDLSARASAGGHDLTATRFRRTEEDAIRAAELVRELIDNIGGTISAQSSV